MKRKHGKKERVFGLLSNDMYYEEMERLIEKITKSRDELLKVKRFGEKKVKKYGEEILEIFKKF